ncbi:MAG: InlB B-repeat-containing protein, partial [Clostridia bacterium]|nr:InlB B-repeat-containing protein [Clostridia bacterium]
VGYTPLFYDPNTIISSNGNTVVDVYYDRNYYLIDLDLTTPDGSKGYGVMPLYVRYGSSVLLGTPTAPGYSFDGWELLEVYYSSESIVDGEIVVTKTTINNNSIINLYSNASSMLNIKHNLRYRSKWSVATTTYTVIYWLENTDSTDASDAANYSIWHTKVMNATSGSNTIAGGDHIKKYITGNALTEINKDYPFLSYQSTLTDPKSKVVSADGTTTVNVYYKRNVYTLRFYYARKSTAYNSQWEISSRTNGFGNENNGGYNYRDDDLHLLGRADWGTVLDEPLLKNNVATEKGYTTNSLEYGSYTYKYFEFQAKYGQDIGDKWPIDIMNTPKRNNNGSQAVMSAWTGEYNVRHQHDNPNGTANQTIKGKYEVLDEYLMWDPNYSGWNNKEYNDGIISFLCFWENAANLGWNVPELYRYKIWLPVLEGKTYPATKVINGFEYKATLDENGDGNIDYYLEDVYDTCDNSTVGEQTQPALTGYTSLKRVNVPNIPSNRESDEGYNDSNHLYTTGLTFNNLSNNKYTTEAEFNQIISYKNNPYVRAYIVNYFYSRSQNYLILNDNAGTTPTEIPLAYGASISQYDVEPSYPSTYELGHYDFIGWYQDESGTVEFDFSQTMPDKNLQAYAKWESTKWSVSIYQAEDSDVVLKRINNVEFGTILSSAQEPTRTPPVAGYIFAGWYYEDENGVEKRFDFNTMPVKGNLEIYAKWSSKVPVPFTVYYYASVDGVREEVSTPTTGLSLAGITKTFTAKVNNALYPGFQVGYFPTIIEQSHKMLHGNNVIEFWYNSATTIKYKVTHIFQAPAIAEVLGSSEPLKLSWVETIEDPSNSESQLTVSFLDLITRDKVLQKLGETYPGLNATQREDLWKIIVDMSPDSYSQNLTLVPSANPDDNEVVFNWEGRSESVIYEVHHYFENLNGGYDLNANRKYKALYNSENPGKATFEKITAKGFYYYRFEDNADRHTNDDEKLPILFQPTVGSNGAMGEGLIIEVYYKREQYDYTVVHYDQNTGLPIPGVGTDSRSGPFGKEIKISEVAKTGSSVEGYRLVNGSQVDTLMANNQQIKCYYVKESVYYMYGQIGAG